MGTATVETTTSTIQGYQQNECFYHAYLLNHAC